jgi:hypothetical protein
MTNSIPPAWLAALRPHTRDFVIVDDVTIHLEDGDCPEFVGDELALWCRRQGLRARRMDRLRQDAVRFGFQNHEAAAQFRQLCGLLAR